MGVLHGIAKSLVAIVFMQTSASFTTLIAAYYICL